MIASLCAERTQNAGAKDYLPSRRRSPRFRARPPTYLMALAAFAAMPLPEIAEDGDMFGGMLQAEADDDGNVVSNRATHAVFFHAVLSHALTMPSPWHRDASLLMIVSVLRSLPAP